MSYEAAVAGRVLLRDQVRRIDQLAIGQWGVTGLVLMENAGRGVADVLCGEGVEGCVVICCARGNNGGDGLVAARHLHLRGCEVAVVLCCDPGNLRGDARVNYDILLRTSVPVSVLNSADAAGGVTAVVRDAVREADWVVDALLGTGAIGAPRAPLDAVIDCLNRAPGRKLAIDIPSGLDCDTGVCYDPTFRADHTCTLVAAKPGLLCPAAQRSVGVLHVLDIGIPATVLEALA